MEEPIESILQQPWDKWSVADALASRRWLFAVAFRVLRNAEDAEDAVQDFFLTRWLKVMQTYKPEEGRKKSYVYVCFRNHCLKSLKRRGPVPPAPSVNSEGEPVEIQAPGEQGSPEGHLRSIELLSILRDCLHALDARRRSVVILYYVDGKSLAEIARAIGVTEGHAKVILFRARQALRECLRRKGAAL